MLSRPRLRKKELREQRPESHPGAVRPLDPFSVPDNSPDGPAADRLSSLFCQIQRLHPIGPVSCICTIDRNPSSSQWFGHLAPGHCILLVFFLPPSDPLLCCCFSFLFFCLFSFSSSLFLRSPPCCFSSCWPYVLKYPRILSLGFFFYPIPLGTANSSFTCGLSVY